MIGKFVRLPSEAKDRRRCPTGPSKIAQGTDGSTAAPTWRNNKYKETIVPKSSDQHAGGLRACVSTAQRKELNAGAPTESHLKLSTASITAAKQKNLTPGDMAEKKQFDRMLGRPLANAASLQNSPDYRRANRRGDAKRKENLHKNCEPEHSAVESQLPSLPICHGKLEMSPQAHSTEMAEKFTATPNKPLAESLLPKSANKPSLSGKEQRRAAKDMAPNERIIEINGRAYSLGKRIGEGGTAKVNEVTDVETNREYALKRINLSSCKRMQVEIVSREIEILQKLKDVDLVVKLIDQYNKLLNELPYMTEQKTYLELETEQVIARSKINQSASNVKDRPIIVGHDVELKVRLLVRHIREYKQNNYLFMILEKGRVDLDDHFKMFDYQMSPRMIARYWLGMLRAVNEIHKIGVIHADLKPSNFVLSEGKVKLIDFGISNWLQSEQRSVTQAALLGTVGYMSPEALCARRIGSTAKIKVSTKTDVWSLGIILYRLVYGKLPFDHAGGIPAQIVATCDPKIPISLPVTRDHLAREAIASCLHRNPRRRPTVENLISHPYVTQYFPCSPDIRNSQQ